MDAFGLVIQSFFLRHLQNYEMFHEYGIDLEGKNAVVAGQYRWKTMAQLLL